MRQFLATIEQHTEQARQTRQELESMLRHGMPAPADDKEMIHLLAWRERFLHLPPHAGTELHKVVKRLMDFGLPNDLEPLVKGFVDGLENMLRRASLLPRYQGSLFAPSTYEVPERDRPMVSNGGPFAVRAGNWTCGPTGGTLLDGRYLTPTVQDGHDWTPLAWYATSWVEKCRARHRESERLAAEQRQAEEQRQRENAEQKARNDAEAALTDKQRIARLEQQLAGLTAAH